MDVAISKNKVLIRLTEERWQHISIGHPEIAGFYFEILELLKIPVAFMKVVVMNLLQLAIKKKQKGNFW